MMKHIFKILFFITVLLAIPQRGIAQFTVPEVPGLQTSVYDYASLLSPTEKSQLEQKLIRYADTTSTQIVAAIVPDLKGSDAQGVATEWAEQWGIGQKGKDNGIFILVSIGDRKMHIVTGYGVQGRLPAGIVGTIIRRVITPEFKKGDYYAGLDKGADAIFAALNGKFKEERENAGRNDGGDGWMFFIPFVIFFLVVIFAIIFGGKGGGRGGNGGRRGFGGSDIADILILSSLGRGWGSGGGSSGGGFGGGSSGGFGGGFGGGGFSGGGAGGSW